MQRWNSFQDLTRCKNDNLGVNCAKTSLLRTHRPVTNEIDCLFGNKRRFFINQAGLGNRNYSCRKKIEG